MYGGTTAAFLAMIALPGAAGAGTARQEERVAQSAEGEAVANLPFARGRSFRTLDDYLAHLEKQGAIDLPWWKEVALGVYEKQTSLRRKPPERATREELMHRFGFSR